MTSSPYVVASAANVPSRRAALTTPDRATTAKQTPGERRVAADDGLALRAEPAADEDEREQAADPQHRAEQVQHEAVDGVHVAGRAGRVPRERERQDREQGDDAREGDGHHPGRERG